MDTLTLPELYPFKLFLFGGFHLTLNDSTYAHFYSDKVRALLCYLVMAEQQPVRRTTITELLWPGYAKLSARTSLRRALTELRKTLAPYPVLATTYQTVQLGNLTSVLWCDVQVFSALANGCPMHQPLAQTTCAACMASQQHALSLYRGEFLQDFTQLDSGPFHHWRQAQALRLAQAAANLARHLDKN